MVRVVDKADAMLTLLSAL